MTGTIWRRLRMCASFQSPRRLTPAWHPLARACCTPTQQATSPGTSGRAWTDAARSTSSSRYWFSVFLHPSKTLSVRSKGYKQGQGLLPAALPLAGSWTPGKGCRVRGWKFSIEAALAGKEAFGGLAMLPTFFHSCSKGCKLLRVLPSLCPSTCKLLEAGGKGSSLCAGAHCQACNHCLRGAQ